MSVIPPPPPPGDALPPPSGGPVSLSTYGPPTGPPATAPVESPPEAFGQGAGHGFGPPTGPPSTGAAAPPAGPVRPPPARNKVAWLPVVAGVLYGLFRIGLIVFSIAADDDPPSPSAQMDGVIDSPYGPLDASALNDDDEPQAPQVGDCYDSNHLATPCDGTHAGEIVTVTAVPDEQAGRAEADRRCAEVVEATIGGAIPADTEILSDVLLGDTGIELHPVFCHVAALPGRAPLYRRVAPAAIELGACYGDDLEVAPCDGRHLGQVVTAVRLDRDADPQQGFYACIDAVSSELGGALPAGVEIHARPVPTMGSYGLGAYGCSIEPRPGAPILDVPADEL